MINIFKLKKKKKSVPRRKKVRRCDRSKASKTKGRKKKWFKNILLFLILLFSLYWSYNIYMTITSVKITDVIEGHEDIVELSYEGSVRRSLVVYENISSDESKNLFLLAVFFNLDSSQALVYYFPNDLYLWDDVSNKYISVEDLTYAGNTYMYNGKYAYVVSQISKQLAVDFDSYIWIKPDMGRYFVSDDINWGADEDEIMSIFTKLSAPRLIVRYYKANIIADSLHSNMGFIEIYRYFQQLRGTVSSDNYSFIDLGAERMSNLVLLETEREVKALDLFAFDKSLDDNYNIIMSRGVAREHVKVEVYNASETSFYAAKVARKIHNSGCNVVRHGNAPETYAYEKNHIYVPNINKYLSSFNRIRSIIDDPVIVHGRPDFLTTGDIVVILGSEDNVIF